MQPKIDHSRPIMELPQHAQFMAVPALGLRLRFWAWAMMLALLGLGAFLLLDSTQTASRIQNKFTGMESSDAQKIRQYNQRLESLQERMTAFIADSVEDQLRALEKNVASGSVGAKEISAIQELKHEVKLLETYVAGKSGDLTDPMRMDHLRFQATPGSRQATSSAEFLEELLKLKQLAYLGLASCGLGFAMIGGYWWRSHERVRSLPAAFSQTPQLSHAKPEE
jgi:hypothetical protein